MPRFQQDFAVKRMQGIADTAGIQKQRFPSPVHQGTVGVAKEKKIQVLLLGRISCGQQGLLDTIRMAVAEQNTESFHFQHPFGRNVGPEIAIARNLIKGELGGKADAGAGRPASSRPDGGCRQGMTG